MAIDRSSKFAFVELHQEGGKMIAARFLRYLVAAVPYRIHIVLTDNGIQFTNHAHHKYAFHHIFDRVCDENGIEHRLTRVKHPWTKGQSCGTVAATYLDPEQSGYRRDRLGLKS